MSPSCRAIFHASSLILRHDGHLRRLPSADDYAHTLITRAITATMLICYDAAPDDDR